MASVIGHDDTFVSDCLLAGSSSLDPIKKLECLEDDVQKEFNCGLVHFHSKLTFQIHISNAKFLFAKLEM